MGEVPSEGSKTLLNRPKEREGWFKFKDARVRRRVEEWLEDEGIEIIGAVTL